MITGIIAALIAVVVLPAAIGDGNMGTFWIFLGVIAIVLLFGAVSREGDRVYNNFIDYLADGGPKRRK